MVMFKISLDLVKIKSKGLTLNEYLTLFCVHLRNKGQKEPFLLSQFIPTNQDYKSLQDKEFLLPSLFNESGYELTIKANTIFNTGDEKFNEFYALFPPKVPNGLSGFRPVSTKDLNTVGAEKTKQLWKAITKDDIELQIKIIDSLKKELSAKEASGSLMYLAGIDTWLRNYTWEKWESVDDPSPATNNNVKKL